MYLLTFTNHSELVTRWDWHRLMELAVWGGWCFAESGSLTGAQIDRPAIVDGRDAQRLGNALVNTLPDIPNHECASHKATDLDDILGALRERWIWPHQTISPLEEFSGERKNLVRSLAETFRTHGTFHVSYLRA